MVSEPRSGEAAKNSARLPLRFVFLSHSSVATTTAVLRPVPGNGLWPLRFCPVDYFTKLSSGLGNGPCMRTHVMRLLYGHYGHYRGCKAIFRLRSCARSNSRELLLGVFQTHQACAESLAFRTIRRHRQSAGPIPWHPLRSGRWCPAGVAHRQGNLALDSLRSGVLSSNDTLEFRLRNFFVIPFSGTGAA